MYPRDMGSPSELIIQGRTGILFPLVTGSGNTPADWAYEIDSLRQNGDAFQIGHEARLFALTEDWSVQAKRFNLACEELLMERRRYEDY